MRTFIQHLNNSNVHQKQNGPIVNSYNGISYAGFLPFAPQISFYQAKRMDGIKHISERVIFKEMRYPYYETGEKVRN